MTPEEKDVLFELVERVKNPKEIITAKDFEKQMMYDFNNGENAAIKLLDRYFLDIIASESFTESEFERLESLLDELDKEWVLVKSVDDIDWDRIVSDRMGYVILDDGTRVDIEPDQFKEEREEYNKFKEERNKRIS